MARTNAPRRAVPSPAVSAWSYHWQRLREQSARPHPRPQDDADVIERVRYGIAQPLLGLRVIVRAPDLLGMSIAPAIGVLLVGVLVGMNTASEHGVARGIVAGWLAIAALAPLPAVLFGRLYAHLASRVRPRLGLPPQAPYIRGVMQLLGEWAAQLAVLALGVLPLTGLLGILPLYGAGLALGIQSAWALHWVVIEGLDNARTLPEGRTVAELEELGRRQPGWAWFHRPHTLLTKPTWLVGILGPVRMFSEVVHTLARQWRLEVDAAERHPWICFGFGLGVVVLVAIPGVNLLFRPAVVVAGVHLREQIMPDASLPAAVRSGDTAPQPVVPMG